MLWWCGYFEGYPLIDEDILEEINHSADANEEEEEEMDEVEIVIVDKPPKTTNTVWIAPCNWCA